MEEVIRRLENIERQLKRDRATNIGIANIVMTTANEEYPYHFPKNMRGFRMQCRDGTAFRYAFEKGKVGTAAPSQPYNTVLSNGHLEVKNILVEELHLYVACGSSSKVVEVISWS